MDTTTERRCEFTDMIAYSCAHCRGHETPEPINYDDYGLPEELHADGLAKALWAASDASRESNRGILLSA